MCARNFNYIKFLFSSRNPKSRNANLDTHGHVLVQSVLPAVAAIYQMAPLFCQLSHFSANAPREGAIRVVTVESCSAKKKDWKRLIRKKCQLNEPSESLVSETGGSLATYCLPLSKLLSTIGLLSSSWRLNALWSSLKETKQRKSWDFARNCSRIHAKTPPGVEFHRLGVLWGRRERE